MAIHQYPQTTETSSSDRLIIMARNKLGRGATLTSGPFSSTPGYAGYPTTHVDAKATVSMFRDQYEACRRELLENGNWMFATERADLIFDSDKQMYKLPENLIKIIKIGECGRRLTSERFGNYIEIGCGCCECILYIRDEHDANLFSPKFTRALVNKLAYEIGFAAGVSETTLARIYRDYQMEMADARKTDLQQRTIRVVRDPRSGYGRSYMALHRSRKACGDCCDGC